MSLNQSSICSLNFSQASSASSAASAAASEAESAASFAEEEKLPHAMSDAVLASSL